jgi:hypothetical protein
MGLCVRKLSNLKETPHSYKASIRAKETAKASHKGNLLLTDNEILFYENMKVRYGINQGVCRYFFTHVIGISCASTTMF